MVAPPNEKGESELLAVHHAGGDWAALGLVMILAERLGVARRGSGPPRPLAGSGAIGLRVRLFAFPIDRQTFPLKHAKHRSTLSALSV